ncbi:uncharacterized protein LOC144143129 [Haemaphysalis longicornis]
MPYWIFGRKVRDIRIRTKEGRHRPSKCHSLMARSFRFHSWLCRLCGCFFIKNLYGRKDRLSPKVVWKSWYTIYATGCLAFIMWLDIGPLIINGREAVRKRDKLHISLRVFMDAILLIRMIINFFCMSIGSSKLVAFYLRASTFERHIRMASCDCCAPRRFLWSDVQRGCVCFFYCMVFTLTARDLTSTKGSVLSQASMWTKIVFTMFFYFVYDSVHAVSLRASSQVLAEYIGSQLRVLRECVNIQGTGRFRCVDLPERLEAVRLNLSTIRQLKEEINDVWRWPLVVSSVCVLLVLCSCMYEVCREEFVLLNRISTVLYAAYITYEFMKLAFVSQNLINMAKAVKDTCKTVRSIEDSYFRHQIRHLYDTIDPEDMALKGADFFKLDVSLLVSMAASVITYTVILQQTSETMNQSRNETSTGIFYLVS